MKSFSVLIIIFVLSIISSTNSKRATKVSAEAGECALDWVSPLSPPTTSRSGTASATWIPQAWPNTDYIQHGFETLTKTQPVTVHWKTQGAITYNLTETGKATRLLPPGVCQTGIAGNWLSECWPHFWGPYDFSTCGNNKQKIRWSTYVELMG